MRNFVCMFKKPSMANYGIYVQSPYLESNATLQGYATQTETQRDINIIKSYLDIVDNYAHNR